MAGGTDRTLVRASRNRLSRATVVRHLFERASEPMIRARLTALVPKLLVSHRWCYAARDPYDTGLLSIIHPWESGMDNSPVWDDALAAVEPGPSVAHLRRDTSFAPTSIGRRGRNTTVTSTLSSNSATTATAPTACMRFPRSELPISASMPSCSGQIRILQSLLAATGDAAGAEEVSAMEERTSDAIARCWHEKDGFFLWCRYTQW